MVNPPFHNHSTKLLVSVRNAEEAEAALAGGADWIDLKEPSRGALGAVDLAVARDVAARLGSRAPLSAAAGELRDWSNGTARELLGVEALRVLKLGLAGCRGEPWMRNWCAVQQEINAAGKELAAVIYADADAAESPTYEDVLEAVADSACRWVLIDTFDKRSGTLTKSLPLSGLEGVLARIHSAGHTVVIAGSLTIETVGELSLELIDMVAVRGAACDGGRNGRVSRDRVAELKAVLHGVGWRSALRK